MMSYNHMSLWISGMDNDIVDSCVRLMHKFPNKFNLFGFVMNHSRWNFQSGNQHNRMENIIINIVNIANKLRERERESQSNSCKKNLASTVDIIPHPSIINYPLPSDHTPCPFTYNFSCKVENNTCLLLF